jgi:hypothetical protein
VHRRLPMSFIYSWSFEPLNISAAGLS